MTSPTFPLNLLGWGRAHQAVHTDIIIIMEKGQTHASSKQVHYLS